MNRDQIKGKWKRLRGKVRERWGKLTGAKLDVVAGKRDQWLGKLQEKYGSTKKQAERELDHWRKGLR